MKFAILVSQFNPEVTEGLLKGSTEFLAGKKAQHEIFRAPGAFELPLIAKRLAASKKFAGVICLGCVIKGDTMHFEFISLAATMGILQVGLETETPISFGVLTTLTDEQAVSRSRADAHNKGIEAAAACWETAALLAKL
jgi:6,7-dimethyl-8-ribityllumazine synthase